MTISKSRETFHQFLQKLRHTPRDWFLAKDGAIRRRDFVDTCLPPREQCPLTAIFSLPAASCELECGQQLGLHPHTILEIIRASDFTHPYTDIDKPGITRDQLQQSQYAITREMILRACGLSSYQPKQEKKLSDQITDTAAPIAAAESNPWA